MKEFMPDTHVGTELIRGYAEGVYGEFDGEPYEVRLNFEDIATDRGPRLESTLDMYPSQIPAYGWSPDTWTRKRVVEPYERKLTKAEREKLDELNEDSRIKEAQLTAITFGLTADGMLTEGGRRIPHNPQ